MKIKFIPSEKVIIINGPRRVNKLAKELGISLESHVFIRNNTILTPDEHLNEDDEIEILSVISGG